MSKLRLLLALLVISALCICSLASAQSVTWKDSSNKEWLWNKVGENWVLEFDCHWQDNWGLGTGVTPNAQPYEIAGASPCLDDPTVIQNIYNETSGWWTDWHIDITNGWFTSVGLVAKNLDRPDWAWEVDLSNPDNQGNMTRLFAHVVPGHNTQIYPDEILYLSFNYVGSGAGAVKLTQYPTADMPIPEPASLLALLSGLTALGFQIKKRS